jgi:uridine kinase
MTGNPSPPRVRGMDMRARFAHKKHPVMNGFRLIAVVGGSGSGKSWLASWLGAELGGSAAHLCLDDFYQDLGHLPEHERDKVNFDDPAAIDWESLRAVIECLERGEPASLPMYDFTTHLRKPDTRDFGNPGLVVMEGLWLREKISVSVFVECPEDERQVERSQVSG